MEIKIRYTWKDPFSGIQQRVFSMDDIEAGLINATTSISKETVIARDLWIGVKDKNENSVFAGDIIKCNWLAELGVTELDCEASGVVKYEPNLCQFWVCFPSPYKRSVIAEGHYECDGIEIIGENENFSYEIIGNIHLNPIKEDTNG